VRRRYVARFDVAGKREVALAVFEWMGGVWRGVTAFAPRAGKPADAAKHAYLDNRARFGVLVHVRDDGKPDRVEVSGASPAR
jgi:hypothetical protein